DLVLGRVVAVKVLAPRFASDGRSVARFRREAKSAAALNHPNVVSVYDTGSDDSVHWIVMEHVEGMTLEAVLDEEAPLTARRGLEITVSVCRALAAAHERGLVHRDVKSANVMIDGAGRVKVMDFGIARAIEGDNTLTGTGSILGTASYLSPEQARGDPVDARSDIYSLGCLLYELLAGRPPLTGDSAVAVAYKHVNEGPVPLSLLNPAVPAGLETVVMRALSKDPADRYQSAPAMEEAATTAAQEVGAELLGDADATSTPSPSHGGNTVPLPAPLKRRGLLARAGWALGLVATVVVGFLLGQALLTGGGPSTPDVRLLSREAAVKRLEEAGLYVRVDTARRSDVASGLVVAQVPGPGEEVALGSTVSVVVSSGPRLVVVPELIGQAVDDAESAVAGVGLTLQPVAEVPAFEPAGTVIAQFPEVGTRAETGTAIGVVLSSGPLYEEDDDD
ncbi:MAG: protein kinase domain-containing protein, partial [Actinomycetota bacterium]